jgi:hypothetical protein
MIPPDVVSAVCRLLIETKLSQREIARRTGISRGSVRAIASSRQFENATCRPTEEIDWERPVGSPERCPDCGGLIFPPCILCATRKALARHLLTALRRLTSRGMIPLGLELRPQHRKRYQQVRARRLAWNDNPPTP